MLYKAFDGHVKDHIILYLQVAHLQKEGWH